MSSPNWKTMRHHRAIDWFWIVVLGSAVWCGLLWAALGAAK